MKALSLIAFLVVAGSSLAATGRVQSAEVEVARIKKQLQEIQGQGGTRTAKVQKQRELIEREIARASAELRELQQEQKKESASDSDEAKKSAAAARNRRDAAIANVQKLLEILRGMNPQI